MRLTILGAGPGGYVAAIRAARSGLKVTVVEKDEPGGTCLNRGCIPTKSIIASIELLKKIRLSHNFGIDVPAEVKPDLNKIIARKNKIVQTQVNGIINLFKFHGIEIKKGKGYLLSPRSILVTDNGSKQEAIESDVIIIATGSRPYQIPSIPFDNKLIISSDDALNITDIPKNIVILGAGVIGCEFAFIFKLLGSDVTLVELLPRPLSTEDIDITNILERELKKLGIKLFASTKVEKVITENSSIKVYLSNGKELITDKILVTAGRSFNTENIGIENAGIIKGNRGEILVNNRFQTNTSNIYAVGDVIGKMMLAHVAAREGITAVENIIGNNTTIDYNSIPSAIFTLPEIASVGLREFQANEQGIKINTGHFQFRMLARSHTIGEIDGLVKVISDANTDKLLGVHIIGPHASDIIHEAVLAIRKGLKTKDISETIHAHPTFSEAILEASDDVYGKAIHIIKK